MATTYLLHIYLKKSRRIKIGKSGTFTFKEGNYFYVGSAKRNLMQRIERHLKKQKKKFWHIDYFLQYARIKKVWICNLSEETMATMLSREIEMPVLGFGSSDKKSKSHLFYGFLNSPKIPITFIDSI